LPELFQKLQLIAGAFDYIICKNGTFAV